jgi:uncharacterized protein YgbK (DUF1537 family)
VSIGRPRARGSDVIVVSTNSRRLTAPIAAEQVRIAAEGLPLVSTGLVFKKIDSTFRGHIAAECDALMKLASAPFGVIAPAVPSQGRTMEGGILSVRDIAGNWRLDIKEALKEQGVTAATISPRGVTDAQEFAGVMMQASRNSRFLLCDAMNEQDLAMTAGALWATGCRPLWIGAAGLASQAASLLRVTSDNENNCAAAVKDGPVVLCVGSNHQVTLAQLERVQQTYGSNVLQADAASAGQISSAARGATHLILILDSCSTDLVKLNEQLQEIQSCSPAAILLTGGDTAALVCQAAEAQGLVLEDEVVAGVPVGHIEGGLLDGVRVATKSGGFGGVNCLANCIHCLNSNTTGAR